MSRPGILLTVNAAGWSLCGLSKAAPTESLGRVAPKELASQLVSFAEQHTLNIQKSDDRGLVGFGVVCVLAQ